MSTRQAPFRFEELRDRWRMHLRLSGGLRGLSAALPLLTVAALASGLPAAIRILLALIAAALAALLVAYDFRRARSVDTAAIARHLNHLFPVLEESADLLLVPVDRLNPLQRLQRERIEPRLRTLEMDRRLPRSPVASSAGLLAGAILASLLIPLVGAGLIASGGEQDRPVESAAGEGSADPLGPGSIHVRITPPGYTGLPPRDSSGLDLAAEEGSGIVWTITPRSPADGARLLFEEEEVPLEGAPDDGYRVSLQAGESRIYQLAILREGRETWKSAHARLQVIPDAPPEISFLEPGEDRVVEPATRLKVEAEFRDDHGLGEAAVVATLASGAGEIVRFRQNRLPLAAELSGKEGRAARTLDLAALGMEPGSELYIHVEVRDTKRPEPNVGRSRTFTIRMPGPDAMTAGLGRGLPVLDPPEFLRSQRQIIIDTEKLIADKDRLSEEEFHFRSRTIGRDQSLLRVRYGSLLGEEVEDGRVAGVEEEGEGEMGASGEADSGLSGTASIYPEDLTHLHDSEETLAFFPDPVRRKFRRMLEQMWEAEGRLRTYVPEQALPFEHEALKLLKSIQEQSRIYVNKVGFETSPLAPDEDRLSGDLSEIENATDRRASGADLPTREIRRALAWVRRTPPRSLTTEERAALEEAGTRLRGGALEGSGKDLRALDLISGILEQGEAPSDPEDQKILEEALWGLLPEPLPPAGSRGRREGLLYQAYAQDLEGGS